jgi:superoxide dismutase, Cu-Zn family
MTAIKGTAWSFAIVATVLIGSPSVSGQNVARARATINSCTDGSNVGTATLFETPSPEGVKDVTVLLVARNLTPGKHGVHIHEVGICTPCSAAGSHLDLGPAGSNVPVTANHPYHSGDLINVRADANGSGLMAHVTSRVSLSDGKLSVFDEDGASIVVHALPDTYCGDPTDPNCAGGGRVACGILERIN